MNFTFITIYCCQALVYCSLKSWSSLISFEARGCGSQYCIRVRVRVNVRVRVTRVNMVMRSGLGLGWYTITVYTLRQSTTRHTWHDKTQKAKHTANMTTDVTTIARDNIPQMKFSEVRSALAISSSWWLRLHLKLSCYLPSRSFFYRPSTLRPSTSSIGNGEWLAVEEWGIHAEWSS